MKKLLLALSFSAVVTTPVWACEAPQEKPEIPNPDQAVTAQMVKANNEVKAYVRAQEEYLNCSGLSAGELRRAEKELVAYAEEFNKAIRTFKLASK